MAAGRMRTRRLLGLASSDDYGRPLGRGIDARSPIATVFSDAGGPRDRILSDGIGGGCHGDVGTTPITRVVAMIVMRRSGGLVPRGRNNMNIAAIERAVTGGRCRHGRHGHACRIVSRRRPPPRGGVAMAVGHGRGKNASRGGGGGREFEMGNPGLFDLAPGPPRSGFWVAGDSQVESRVLNSSPGGRGKGWKAGRTLMVVYFR